MSADDVAEWADFANTVAGGAAALAGLLFVGLSLNLAEVLRYPGVPSTPGARDRWVCVAAGALAAGLCQRRERSRARTMYLTLLPLIPGAADRGRCHVVAAARRRPLLGERICGSGVGRAGVRFPGRSRP
jgi:hypothetical protein